MLIKIKRKWMKTINNRDKNRQTNRAMKRKKRSRKATAIRSSEVKELRASSSTMTEQALALSKNLPCLLGL